MRILVIGGSGTIGQAVVKELSQRHTVVTAGRKENQFKVDIAHQNSIDALYKEIGKFDSVIATTGSVHFGPLENMTEKEYAIGLQNKLMGQVNLVLVGLNYINDKGSFTLTSGILNRDPILYGSSAAMVNGALEGFVKAAALEMPRNIRINIVSPTVIKESLSHYGSYFYGFDSIPASRAALAYSKSVEGAQTGQIYCV